MLRYILALAVATGMASATEVVTGGSVAGLRPVTLCRSHAFGLTGDTHELLQNPGFETGSINPWQTTNWVVTTTYPHGGTYCACDAGNYSIMQSVDATPGSEIQSVTFWSRQPDARVQAYDFLYSDGSYGEFEVSPKADWQQFDVTSNLNRDKSLVGFRLWGYSGSGADSTYVDDVSILVPAVHDAAVTEITCPRDTIALDSTYRPVCRVANFGNVAESVQTVMAIQHVGLAPYYTDTAYVSVKPGDTANVQFGPFHPDSAVEHRVSAWTTLPNDTNHLNDTLRQFFWVTGVEAVEEQRPALVGARLGATVMSAASLRSMISDRGFSVRDASGRLAREPRPGVYFVQTAGLVQKVVVTR